MRKFVFAPVATVTALMLAMPGVTLAQTPAQPQSPATPPAATVAAPNALTDLGATDVQITKGKHDMQKASGKFADGSPFRAMLDSDGALRMIGMQDDKPLPADVLTKLVPDTVRNATIFAEFTSVLGVMQDQDRVMVMGQDKAGEKLRAAFSRDGTLQRFGRGDKGGPDKMDGKRGHGEWGDKGGRKHGGKDRGNGPRDGMGPRGDAAPGAMPGQPPLDDDAARAALELGGYTQPGAITRQGGMTLIEAVNAGGQNVIVSINPQGKVVRETAR